MADDKSVPPSEAKGAVSPATSKPLTPPKDITGSSYQDIKNDAIMELAKMMQARQEASQSKPFSPPTSPPKLTDEQIKALGKAVGTANSDIIKSQTLKTINEMSSQAALDMANRWAEKAKTGQAKGEDNPDNIELGKLKPSHIADPKSGPNPSKKMER